MEWPATLIALEKGTNEAWNIVIREFTRLLLFIMQPRRDQRDEQAAEDILVNAWTALHLGIQNKKFPNKDPKSVTKSDFSNFLSRVTRNLWYKYVTRKRNQSSVEEMADYLASDEEDALGGIVLLEDYQEKENYFNKYWDKLSPIEQNVLLLFYFEKLSHKEISEKMDWNGEQRSKNVKAKAIAKLKKLGKNDPGFAHLFSEKKSQNN